MRSFQIDARRRCVIPGDKEDAITFAVKEFALIANQSIAARGRFTVALSGGSTPKAIFEKLASPAFRSLIDWKKVWLFWGDERSVPPSHPDSNYAMAMSSLDALPIPLHQIFRMEVEHEDPAYAYSYGEILATHLDDNKFDLVMLGMGEDGHTASLFPGTTALLETDADVVLNQVPQKGTIRMTLTFPCINRARHITIYVLGKEKSGLIKEVFEDKPLKYPVEFVGSIHTPALWLCDLAATSLLST